MKLWDKGISTDAFIEKFTVGNDKKFDMYLAPYDVLGSIAHAFMLADVGIITQDEADAIVQELRRIYYRIEQGDFSIEDGIEDIHSQIELELTRALGDIGKKIHTGRSRNDQVLVDISLFLRSILFHIIDEVYELVKILIELSEQYKNHLLPGYTHFQIAMPSSFGLWFGAYAESLADDLAFAMTTLHFVNKNPLGSGAGFGSSFPLKRMRTTELLGFEGLHINSVYAQMTRGKKEKLFAQCIGGIAATLSKMAMDITLYMSQNMGFISFPETLTTGSSIMPHKKNPDVFELIRAKCNVVQTVQYSLHSLMNNLPSGYHRDMQLTKEILFPALYDIVDCISMMKYALPQCNISSNIMENDVYTYAFSVDEVNKAVQQGMSFRDAYKYVAQQIQDGTYSPSLSMEHTHEGSMGNLCNDMIREQLEYHYSSSHRETISNAEKRLLGIE